MVTTVNAPIATRKSSCAINQKICRPDLISWVHGRHKTGITRKDMQKVSQGSGQNGCRPHGAGVQHVSGRDCPHPDTLSHVGSVNDCAATTKEDSKAPAIVRCKRSKSIKNQTLNTIISRASGSRIILANLQQRICDEIRVRLHITYVRKIMYVYDLPQRYQKRSTSRANKKTVRN